MLRECKEMALTCIFSLQASMIKVQLNHRKNQKLQKPYHIDSIKSDARTLLFATMFSILTE
jgi:hypothetical protein